MSYMDLISAQYMAAAWTESPNASAADYLGTSLFGFEKQMSMKLAWIKGSGGVPVMLSPSAFDGEVPLRGRIGAKAMESEIPLFREGIQLTESDTRDLIEAESRGDSYVLDVLRRIFNDSNNLIAGAKIIPELMIWQLMAPEDGKPKIHIAANGVDYSYDYDGSGKWFQSNFTDISTNPWSAISASKPLDNITAIADAAVGKGTSLRYMIMSKKTFNELMQSEQLNKVILSQNATATVYVTETIAKSVIEQLTGIRPVIYNAIYADENGNTKNFYPDKLVTFIPEGQLGKRVFSVTPEEFSLRNSPEANVAIIDDSIAITTTQTSVVPVRIATYASEMVLPSFERMDEVFVAKVDV